MPNLTEYLDATMPDVIEEEQLEEMNREVTIMLPPMEKKDRRPKCKVCNKTNIYGRTIKFSYCEQHWPMKAEG